MEPMNSGMKVYVCPEYGNTVFLDSEEEEVEWKEGMGGTYYPEARLGALEEWAKEKRALAIDCIEEEDAWEDKGWLAAMDALLSLLSDGEGSE
ncbi:MAG: hypothetical protein H0U55_14575 [Rubrobacteraceae bacterium]|nr:hypothetical protein [Rubrobacteraceae bacterium]